MAYLDTPDFGPTAPPTTPTVQDMGGKPLDPSVLGTTTAGGQNDMLKYAVGLGVGALALILLMRPS